MSAVGALSVFSIIGESEIRSAEIKSPDIKDEIAGICGTINYEIVCGISKRVPRINM